MLQLPVLRFLDPLYKSFKNLIRSPTALSRSKTVIIKVLPPVEFFEAFMSPLAEADCLILVHGGAANSLLPTSKSSTLNRYKYNITKGSSLAKPGF